ncbi:MAG: hypothetical protein ACYDA8_09625 [Deferrisomatales bacterium]
MPAPGRGRSNRPSAPVGPLSAAGFPAIRGSVKASTRTPGTGAPAASTTRPPTAAVPGEGRLETSRHTAGSSGRSASTPASA